MAQIPAQRRMSSLTLCHHAVLADELPLALYAARTAGEPCVADEHGIARGQALAVAAAPAGADHVFARRNADIATGKSVCATLCGFFSTHAVDAVTKELFCIYKRATGRRILLVELNRPGFVDTC
jgi:hypothetical protein